MRSVRGLRSEWCGDNKALAARAALRVQRQCRAVQGAARTGEPDFPSGERDLGLIVSNAGDSLLKGEFTADSRASLEAMFNLNTRFPLLLLHTLVPRLKARGRGGIILTGSIEGEVPFPYSSAYPATKAFVHSLGQCLYGELKPAGVDVLVLAPGATATAALTRQGLSAVELPNVMMPAEVSRLALEQLGRKPFVIAGRSNRIMIGLMMLLPRSKVIAMAAKGTRSVMEKARR